MFTWRGLYYSVPFEEVVDSMQDLDECVQASGSLEPGVYLSDLIVSTEPDESCEEQPSAATGSEEMEGAK